MAKKQLDEAAPLEAELVDDGQGMDAPVVADDVPTLKAADLRETAPLIRVRAKEPVGHIATPDGPLAFACDAAGEYLDTADAALVARLALDPRFVVEG